MRGRPGKPRNELIYLFGEAMSWVGWRKFYYYCCCRKNIMSYLEETLTLTVLTAMCMYGYLILIVMI